MTTMRRWPDWMPLPLQSSYTYQTEDRRRKTEMEIGGVYRKEFDTDITKLTCILDLDNVQANFFETFERELLQQGSIWFEFPLQVGGTINYHIVRFTERPKLSGVIGVARQQYSISLQVSKRHIMESYFAEFLMIFSPYDIHRMSEALHSLMAWLPGKFDVPAWGDYILYEQNIRIAQTELHSLMAWLPGEFDVPYWTDYVLYDTNIPIASENLHSTILQLPGSFDVPEWGDY